VGIAPLGARTTARLVAASGRPQRRQGSNSLPVSCLVGNFFALVWGLARDITRRFARCAGGLVVCASKHAEEQLDLVKEQVWSPTPNRAARIQPLQIANTACFLLLD
jgi:hypothetical protein